LIVLIVILIAVFYFFFVRGGSLFGGGQAEPTPTLSTIVIARQPIGRDQPLTADALEEIPYPDDRITETMYRTIGDIVREGVTFYAIYPIEQNVPITSALISTRPGIVQEGSDVAKTIPPGMTAISIPISRLSAVGYAIRDGDRVNVIASSLFVDVDASFQSALPNFSSVVLGTGFVPDSLPVLSVSVASGGSASAQGRAELEPTLNQAIYLVPSEAQRPRLVSQLILQDIQVLHIGSFNLVGDQTAAPTPDPQGNTPPVAPPDMITLIVNPQDAITLTYLLYSNVQLNLTLRAPDDQSRVETEAATLQYILSQYNIPIPAKLPYAISPRIDRLIFGGVSQQPEFPPQ
jgi:pilus assembly protein CpaB